jgi:hypothetical protein
MKTVWPQKWCFFERMAVCDGTFDEIPVMPVSISVFQNLCYRRVKWPAKSTGFAELPLKNDGLRESSSFCGEDSLVGLVIILDRHLRAGLDRYRDIRFSESY